MYFPKYTVCHTTLSDHCCLKTFICCEIILFVYENFLKQYFIDKVGYFNGIKNNKICRKKISFVGNNGSMQTII